MREWKEEERRLTAGGERRTGEKCSRERFNQCKCLESDLSHLSSILWVCMDFLFLCSLVRPLYYYWIKKMCVDVNNNCVHILLYLSSLKFSLFFCTLLSLICSLHTCSCVWCGRRVVWDCTSGFGQCMSKYLWGICTVDHGTTRRWQRQSGPTGGTRVTLAWAQNPCTCCKSLYM